MARDVWTERMRRELGGSTKEEREWVEAVLREWDYQYHKSFTRQIRCEAHARSTGKPCQAPSMRNGRCKLHGGMSTGPRSKVGRAKIAAAQRLRHAKARAIRAAQSP